MSYFNPEHRTHKSPLPLLILGGLCLFALYYAFVANQTTQPVLPENAVRPHLVHWLEENPDAWPAQDPIFNPAAVRRIYQRTDYRLLWFNNYSLSDTANDLLKQLTAASSGNASSMVDYRYHLGYFDRTLRDTPQRLQMAAVLDVLLTDAFVSYAQDTRLDKIKPKSRRPRGITPVHNDESGFRTVAQSTSDERTVRSRHYSMPRSQPRAYQSRPYRGRSVTTSRPRFSAGGLPPRYQRTPSSVDRRGDGGLPPVGRVSENSEGPYIAESTPFGGDSSALREELARIRAISASGRWRPLPRGPAMTMGAKHPHVALLRNMLALYGDYYSYSGEYNNDKFDHRLHEAVLRFQKRHGLRDDGIVGRETRRRLNLSPAARAQIIEKNIRRREELPENLGKRFVHVNIPEYKLHYVEYDRVQLSMKAVVGKKIHETPEVTTRVSKVVFNPTWTVPRSILMNELLPKAQANPAGMEKMGYRVVGSNGELLPLTQKNLSAAKSGANWVRQVGGEDNILGRVKFVIPNKYDVYLHDTRARSLFTRTERGYSHGCVRLENPRHLAEALLRPQSANWDQWRIDQLTTGDETTEVELKERVPVYLTYWTAWVDGSGQLNFRPDIYGKDGVQW